MNHHVLDQLMLWLLAFYQKFVSPYKGFKCAYGVWTGQSTCSAEAKKILKQDGLIAGWPKIQAQLQHCKVAYQLIQGVPVLATANAVYAASLLESQAEQDRRERDSAIAEFFGELGCELGFEAMTCDCSL